MRIQQQILDYIATQTESKRNDVQILHDRILQALPKCKLWFLTGKDATGKVVTNPQIGYGIQTITNASGKSKSFYQIGYKCR